MSPIHGIPSTEEIRRRLDATRRERSILRRLFRLAVEAKQLRAEHPECVSTVPQAVVNYHGTASTEAASNE